MLTNTDNPKVFFGKGNIFDVNEFGFDGIGAIFYNSWSFGPEKFGIDMHDYLDSANEIPLCVYYNDRFRRDNATVHNFYHGVNPKVKSRQVVRLVYRMLDYLNGNCGCRKIGFHGAPISDGTYAEGARLTLEAVKMWVNDHPDAVDSITLVDINGDYEKRFG